MRSIQDLNLAYAQSLDWILKNGDLAFPRGFTTKELISYQLGIDSSRCVLINPVRKLSYPFMVAEWLWILFGRNDTEFVGRFNKHIGQFSDNGLNFYGAYGPRFRAQLAHVYNSLSTDPNSRQAVMTFWHQNPEKSKDIPCTVGLHFVVRGGALHLLSWMRSNDAWLGMPYDTFNFCQLQNFLAGLLKVRRGTYVLTANSYHLYDDKFAVAQKAVEWQEPRNDNVFQPATSDILVSGGVSEYEEMCEIFNQMVPHLLNGELNDEAIRAVLPPGISEHVVFLNRFVRGQDHRAVKFWKEVYELNGERPACA